MCAFITNILIGLCWKYSQPKSKLDPNEISCVYWELEQRPPAIRNMYNNILTIIFTLKSAKNFCLLCLTGLEWNIEKNASEMKAKLGQRLKNGCKEKTCFLANCSLFWSEFSEFSSNLLLLGKNAKMTKSFEYIFKNFKNYWVQLNWNSAQQNNVNFFIVRKTYTLMDYYPKINTSVNKLHDWK